MSIHDFTTNSFFFNFRFIAKIANWLERKIQREAYGLTRHGRC